MDAATRPLARQQSPPSGGPPAWLPALLALVGAAVLSLAALLPRGAAVPPLAAFGLSLAAAGTLWLLRRAKAAAAGASRLRAEAALVRGELDAVLAHVSDGLYVLDQDWRVREVNDAALLSLHRPREALVGAVLWDAFPGLRGSAFGAGLLAAMADDATNGFSAEFVPLAAWHEVRCLRTAGGLTVFFRDVTRQRETEERLRQSQKLEALGQLTGGVAHDVNNLLTVILGNLEMLAQDAQARGAAGAEDRALAEAGLRAGDSASRLMHRLLAFSRRQPLQPQVVDVGALLSSMEPMLHRTLGETVALDIVVEDGLWRALIDPAGLENAILNLALNGRDAMPHGGRLRLAASNIAVDRVYAAVAGLERTGDYVQVAVADTGVGMGAEVRRQAFDPFFTTKPAGRGTGLGLSMVYGFATQSGGAVLLDSEPGQGTIVRLYLPRTRGAPDAPVPPAPDAAVPQGNETLLVVEDNAMLREHTQAMLRSLGYAVHVAGDGADALLALHEGLRPDLLFTDMVLPGGMTGRDVADAAARIVPGLRVLFTSGLPPQPGSDLGPPLVLLRKPYRRADLAARLRERLAAPPWQPAARGL